MAEAAAETQPSTQGDGSIGTLQTMPAPPAVVAAPWARLIALPPRSVVGVLDLSQSALVLGRATPKIDDPRIRCASAPGPAARTRPPRGAAPLRQAHECVAELR